MHASRAGEALSANTRIPTVATPTAPMPVQIAYAVPTGIVRSAWVSNHRLTAAAAAVATLGHSRAKPSVYFRPIAKPIPNTQASSRSNNAMGNSLPGNAKRTARSRATVVRTEEGRGGEEGV